MCKGGTSVVTGSAEAYVNLGFDGLAIGGLVPRISDLDLVLAVVDAVKGAASGLPIHVFGLGKPGTAEVLYAWGFLSRLQLICETRGGGKAVGTAVCASARRFSSRKTESCTVQPRDGDPADVAIVNNPSSVWFKGLAHRTSLTEPFLQRNRGW